MENTRDRLVRYLDDAWSVEKSLVADLKRMADEVSDETVRAAFLEHRDLTHQQEEALEARIRALGDEPSGGAGWFGQLMSKVGDVLHRPHDDYDQTTQDVMKAYAIENFEMAMYQSLLAYANAIGDADTAALAQHHLEQERTTAERIWGMIEPCGRRAVQTTDTTARAA